MNSKSPYNEPGDEATVSIVAPAGALDEQEVIAGINILKNHFKVQYSRKIFKKKGYLAGSDQQRVQLFQQAIDNRDNKVIIAARGGFGSTRIIDELDFSFFIKKTGVFVGSSDLTAFLITLWDKYRYRTIHGPMVASYSKIAATDMISLVNLIKKGADEPSLVLESGILGTSQGPLIGGNLTILAHLCGTVSPVFAKGCILFIEDINEPTYKIDRYLTQLKRCGIFKDIKGMVAGSFTNCNSGPDGTTIKEVLLNHLRDLCIPVAFEYPAAHGIRNKPFIHGGEVLLEVNKSNAKLSFT